MSIYKPDHWVVVELVDSNGVKHQKVFAGWGGSYTYGESWKMNSGITKVDDSGDTLSFHGQSGSVYQCRKDLYGMSSYMQSVFQSFEKQALIESLVIKVLEKNQVIK